MSQKRVLIFGGTGMLGNSFFETQKEIFEILPISRNEANIENFPMVLNQISLHAPDVIINLAAYTDVISAEGIGKMKAFQTNALGAQNVAKAAGAFGVPLIYISTDYVFDGNNTDGYITSDAPNPLNSYGMSKYLGEQLSQREYSETIVIRTSALYGGPLFGQPGSKMNFINKILKHSQEKSELQVVADQFTIPTSCSDLSKALALLINHIEDFTGQTLHFVSESSSNSPVSWYDYALEIQTYLPLLPKIQPISNLEYQIDLERPKYAFLRNTSEIVLPDWRDGLKGFFEK